MKSLCTFAALAVATAIACGSLADAISRGRNAFNAFRQKASELTAISDDQHCTAEINAWRKQVDPNAEGYQPYTSGNPTTDLNTFFTKNDCSVLKSGEFTHIIDDTTSGKTFVFSASRPDNLLRDEMTCKEALEQWKTGFSEFEGNYPAKYQQGTGAYAKPNAVGLVSLLSGGEQNIYCGNPTGCDAGTIICYIKPPAIQEGSHPVTPQLWHKVEESFNLKPKVADRDEGHQDCVDAVNAIRELEELDLPKFTAPTGKTKLQLTKSVAQSTTYENALYNVTCKEIDGSSIDPKVEDEYTLIYAVKDGQIPPTPEEAIEFWRTGYDMLGPDVPPAFKTKVARRDEETEGEIYYKSAVAGFASLMVDTTHEMRCYNATGCEKAALICFLSKPTLVEGVQPISDTTWKKILALANRIQVEKREEADNCLKEINEFRTQDSLGLSAFVAKSPTSTNLTDEEVAEYDFEELNKVLTCDALKAGNAPILISNNKRSVMYYSGSSAMCSNAVTEWKKGYERFKDVTIPPKYTSSEDMYKTGAATNFISLVSEGEETVARCYTVTNCSEEGLVCVLEPAVFEEGKLPIRVTTWKKVTKTLSSGGSSPSVYCALVSSVLVVAGLFALNF